MAVARRRVSHDFLRAVSHAAENVRPVAEKQMPRAWSFNVEPGVRIAQMVRPMESIGCYIPGGRFALVSTLVMTMVTAKVAGVPTIVAECPRPNGELLAAADLLGVTMLARIGGAQAIAALAYGTKRIAPVEKICGPGQSIRDGRQTVGQLRPRDRSAGGTDGGHRARK
jgi:histidinol dehydrogenase